jgi:hypothetical protein
MANDKRALRAWLASIRDILHHDWNPIDHCPEDEYDKYMNDLASLIHVGANNDELLRYLEWAEVQYMNLESPFDQTRAHKVVAALRALGPLQRLH